jgi:hypothetical protein
MTTTKLLLPKCMASLVLMLFMVSCQKETGTTNNQVPGIDQLNRKANPGFAENDMVMYWNAKTQTVLEGPYNPPSTSRYFTMIQIAVHDALNSIKPKFETYALKNHRDKLADPDAAVASAAYWTIKLLGLQQSLPLETWYTESIGTVPAGPAKLSGIALGKKAAEAIIAKRATDNYETVNVMTPGPDGTEPGQYRSTLPWSNTGMPKIKALQQWGTQLTPFATQSHGQFRPDAPHPVNSSQYTVEYNEVKSKGGAENHTRTPQETEIGVFWVEKSAIGWNRLSRNVIANKKMDAWKTARMLALVHTAMTDAVSGCFEAKYHYKYWRPETAIRSGSADGNNATEGDAGWLPSYIEIPAAGAYTPPLPEYPSAHASFGGAAAEVLKLLLGSDAISINMTSGTLQGVTRHYSSLSDAARDNSLSRIYVGYHFRYACLKGEEQGREIGAYVFNNSFRDNDNED